MSQPSTPPQDDTPVTAWTKDQLDSNPSPNTTQDNGTDITQTQPSQRPSPEELRRLRLQFYQHQQQKQSMVTGHNLESNPNEDPTRSATKNRITS